MPDLRIESIGPPTSETMHRFRNFGEAVYVALRDRYTIDLAEVDTSTTQFHVRGVPRRSLRATAKEIAEMASTHGLARSVSINVVE